MGLETGMKYFEGESQNLHYASSGKIGGVMSVTLAGIFSTVFIL